MLSESKFVCSAGGWYPCAIPRLRADNDGHGAIRRVQFLLLRVPQVLLHEVPTHDHVPPVRQKHWFVAHL
jgi:hypothetical protein